MGIIRKVTSVSSAGLVDFRSDKERTARYTRQTRNAVRAQSRMQADLAALQASTQTPPPAVAGPAGWFPYRGDPAGTLRWFDGYVWTTHMAAPGR